MKYFIMRAKKIMALLLAVALSAGVAVSCSDSTDIDKNNGTDAYDKTPATGNGGEASEKDRYEAGRDTDLIMWYDIDHSRTANTRPDRGWYYLYKEHPDMAVTGGLYRGTTPLLGLYDQARPETANQHLYWMSALGCNAAACDWSNYSKYTVGTDNSDRYFSGIYKCTAVLLEQAIANKDKFETPSVYVTPRLFGEDYNALRKVLDDIYTLYETYKEKWYVFDDGTENADKPFIMIFADHTYLRKWASQGYADFDDSRFNIRWTNGSVAWEKDKNGYNCTPLDNFWIFWDCVRHDDGSYEVSYAKGKDGSIEEMAAWASVHLGGLNWEEMLAEVNGLTTFERNMLPVLEAKPKALIVCRFNYPYVWLEEPQEGVSLMKSTHIEPNVDLGFSVFDDVRNSLYSYEGWKQSAPEFKVEGSSRGSIANSLKEYVQEYAVSYTGDFTDAEWTMFNMNDQIEISNKYTGSDIYVKLRNSFGESETAHFTWDDAASAWKAQELIQ